MKKYLAMLALLLFGKAEAQKTYPKIKNDTAVTVAHCGDSAIITRTKIKTVIDSEIVVFYHGMRCVTATKTTEYRTVLSQKIVTIGKEVSAKFRNAQQAIDEYLLSGRQNADPEYVVSLMHGALKVRYLFYLKNDVLRYKKEQGFSAASIAMFMLFCLALVSGNLFMLSTGSRMETRRESVATAVFCIVMEMLLLEFTLLDNRLNVWDEMLVPVITSVALFFLTKYGIKLYLRRQREK